MRIDLEDFSRLFLFSEIIHYEPPPSSKELAEGLVGSRMMALDVTSEPSPNPACQPDASFRPPSNDGRSTHRPSSGSALLSARTPSGSSNQPLNEVEDACEDDGTPQNPPSDSLLDRSPQLIHPVTSLFVLFLLDLAQNFPNHEANPYYCQQK